MALSTYPVTVKDGKVYAEVTLRDIIERSDVDGLPFLTEIKRLYDENDELKDLCYELLDNLMSEICNKAFWCRDKDWHKCEDYGCGNFTFVILARELGIEV
jgi:hypothetical protein